jgi:hypothetical protein
MCCVWFVSFRSALSFGILHSHLISRFWWGYCWLNLISESVCTTSGFLGFRPSARSHTRLSIKTELRLYVSRHFSFIRVRESSVIATTSFMRSPSNTDDDDGGCRPETSFSFVASKPYQTFSLSYAYVHDSIM